VLLVIVMIGLDAVVLVVLVLPLVLVLPVDRGRPQRFDTASMHSVPALMHRIHGTDPSQRTLRRRHASHEWLTLTAPVRFPAPPPPPPPSMT